LTAKFGYKSPMEVPRITKITLNMGVSEAVADKKVMDNAVSDLTKIAGQKPVVTKAKKAIAGFKIREGQAIGTMVTLRGTRMYEFLDRFVTVALPRVRDFRGISGRAFDGRGNYNIGVKEQIIFPEIEYDKVDALRGLNISITTTAKNDEECKALLAFSSACFFAYLATSLSRLSSRSIKATLATMYLQFLNGKRKPARRALHSSSFLAVVVMLMFRPRSASTLSYSISGKMICSLTPML